MGKSYFDDKVVWITGASSGIGAEIANQISNYQVKLILTARSEKELMQVKEKCEKKGIPVHLIILDQSVPDNLAEKAREAIAIYGRVDIFFNNGGITQRSLVHETPIEVDRKVMEIDYFSGIIMTKELLPVMLKNGFGHFVATSSLAGRFGFPLRSAYSAAKHAMYGYFESIHAELSPKNIHVTILAPGRINTQLSKTAITKDGSEYGKIDVGQANGMSVEKMVRKVLKAVRKQKVSVLIGNYEILTVYIKRFFPGIFYKIVTKINPT